MQDELVVLENLCKANIAYVIGSLNTTSGTFGPTVTAIRRQMSEVASDYYLFQEN